MGNVLTGIKQYLGYEEISSPSQMVKMTEDVRNKNIEDQIKALKKQMDSDRNNTVSKYELEQYFEYVAAKIDENSDGIITHDELETYVADQLKSSENEIEKWKSAYEQLHDKYEQLIDDLRNEENRIIEVSQISSQALKDYIESEIINTDANLRLVPDPIERKIYLTVYKTIMKSLEGLFNTTSFNVLNHTISFAIQPIPLKDRNNNIQMITKDKQ